jgi:hypothetical protein
MTVYNFKGLEPPYSFFTIDDHTNTNGAAVVTEFFRGYLAKEN